MGRVPLYAWAIAGLSLVIIAVYFISPVTIGVDDSRDGDTTLVLRPPTSYSPTPAQKKEILNLEKTYDVTRGKTSSHEVSVTNPFENSAIEGLNLTLGGSFAKYMQVLDLERTDADGEKIELSGRPSEVPLGYGETQKYEITVDVPQYVERGTYYVDLEIHKGNVTYRDYPGVSTGTGDTTLRYKDITFEIIERRTIAFNVHTYTEDEAQDAFEEAAANIGNMRNAGFSTRRAEGLLDDARAELSEGDYEAAIEIGEEISKMSEDAFNSRSGINELGSVIKDAEEARGLKVPETKELLSLAVAAFEREDYEIALERINYAKLVYASETRGKVNYTKMVLDNLLAIVIGGGVLLALLFAAFAKAKALFIIRELKNLDAREANIANLMKESQEKYYIQKTLSADAYTKAMSELTEKLTQIRGDGAKLRAKRAGLIRPHEELKRLREESINLEGLIRDAQDRYYSKKTMSRREYDESMEHFRSMQIDVEGAIAVLETRVLK